nr:MAG TPA: hypothetical protein [Caudoviricetes sp.]
MAQCHEAVKTRKCFYILKFLYFVKEENNATGRN